MAGIFVLGLIIVIDRVKVTSNLKQRVVKNGFPYFIECIVMENKTDCQQKLTKESLVVETKLEIVLSGISFSALLAAKGPRIVRLKVQSGNSSLVGQKFLDRITSSRFITNSKEIKLLLFANLSG